MKVISLKLDNYMLQLLNQCAKQSKTTRMEVIRAAILNYFLNREDAADLAYIQQRKKDRLLEFDEIFE